MNFSKVAFVLLVAILIAIPVFGLVRRAAKRVAIGKTWTSYLSGQGFVLLLFLLIGWLAAAASTRWGPSRGEVVEHVQLIQFDSLTPADHPFREIDTARYASITIFAKAIAPENGAAVITIYADRGGIRSGRSEVRHITSVANAWSRWDHVLLGQRVSFVVAPAAERNISPASQVQVLVYLSPRQTPQD